MRVGYVVKRYPRYSETFIVNEILAHEAAGVDIEIFALRPPNDRYFQDIIAEVRSPVNYLYLSTERWMPEDVATEVFRSTVFWEMLQEASEVLPNLWAALKFAKGEEVRDVYQAILLAKQVREKNICHLHAHFGTQATTVARLAAYFAEIPYTFTAHAKDIFHESVQHQDLQRKLSDASATVTISDYNLTYLQTHYGAAADRVQRIYNGLDLNRFPYQLPQATEGQEEMRIVSVGRLIEKKGFADLITACNVLALRGCRFTCQIIGTGSLEFELQQQIEQLDLLDRVMLVNARPQKEVIEMVQNATLFVAPYVVGIDGNRDGLPTVLLEAMALGTPCISTDVTGVPEVVRHLETGWIVPQHNPAALADAIEHLFTNLDQRIQFSKQARHLIETEFDIHRNAANLRTLFRASQAVDIKTAQEVY